MPTLHEPAIKVMPIPPISYPELIIPAGRAAHIGDGLWFKRCPAPWCNLSWTRRGGFYGFEREHAAHAVTHNIDVPGHNVGILS